jgi:hypothetical protein
VSAHQFKVGDPVVCVDAEDADQLREGQTYTIREIGIEMGWFKDRVVECVCLALNEAKGKTLLGNTHESGFAAARFRHVQTRKTDISIFHALLTPTEDDITEIELLDYELVAEVAR